MSIFDYKLFESVPIQDLINENDVCLSDKESIKSEEHLSDEEYKNNYSFLENFKKKKIRNKKKSKLIPKPLVEETYISD